MNERRLRSPRERVGTLPNADLPPPEEPPSSVEEPSTRPAAGEETPSAEWLLRRALLEGDEQAFETVVEGLRPHMLRIATRYVRSRDEAEDVVQDTWLAALTAIERFEGRASLRTWLLRILGYRARSAGSKASRLVPFSQLEPGSAAASNANGADGVAGALHIEPPPAPDDVLLRRELGARIEASVARLPERQRVVLTLRDVEGRSAGQVCRTLGLSPGNQRVLLHRARQQVRASMADYFSGVEREAVAV